jgi:hypothetical protein
MSLVRHQRRFKRVHLCEIYNQESLKEIVDYKQGKLYIDDDISDSTNSVQPLKTKPKTKFMAFLEKIKKWIIK